jgi:hypothetical protein
VFYTDVSRTAGRGKNQLIEPVDEFTLSDLVGKHIVVNSQLPSQVFSAWFSGKCLHTVHKVCQVFVTSEEPGSDELFFPGND